VPYAEAKSILDTLREDFLPGAFRGKPPSERQALWPRWLAARDAEIRARLYRGDEDSTVNFLWFGVTFTKLPRIRLADLLSGAPPGIELLQRRAADLVRGAAAPGADARLQFVRRVLQRKGVDPASASRRDRAEHYLLDLATRVLADVVRYDPTIQTGAASDTTLFRDRGLASDTMLASSFGIDRALEAARARGTAPDGRVKRVGIVGPGLDVIDKYEGYDFYPEQTIQPFAVLDSLVRLHLATRGEVRITTFDLSPRVNRHIEAARQAARGGTAYVVQLPRDTTHAWSDGLIAYWEQFGSAVGRTAKPMAPPPGVDHVDMSARRFDAPMVLAVLPRDLNIVIERSRLAAAEAFDLIVATNILDYYDVFEQSLALSNISNMLRPGGLLLCNNALPLLPAIPMRVVGYTDVVFSADGKSGDRVMWYQRE
jgi:hypothetical protein